MHFSALMKKINDWAVDYYGVIRQAFRSMSRDNINLLASGMVYSTLIAIVPCLTFLSAFLSAFGALEPFMAVISEWLCDTFGEGTGISVMESIMKFTGSAMSLGVVGLVSFIITGMFLVNKVYSLVNHIFRTEPSEGTMKRLMLIIMFIIVLTVVLTFGFALSSSLSQKFYSLMGKDVETSAIGEMVGVLGRFAVVFAVYFVMITAVPNVKIRVASSVSGAALGTLLTYVSTFFFSRIISYSVGYSVIYGSLASILFVLLFLYIIWYIVVLVMEVTYIHQFRPDKDTLIGKPVAGETQISDSIDVILLIARRFEEGKGSTSIKDMSASLSMPMSRLNNVLSDLESSSLIVSINPQGTAFMLKRPSDSITFSDVVEAVFSSEIPKDRKRSTEGTKLALAFKNKGKEDLTANLKEALEEKI